jgi:uncharacterized protein (DUF1499 family)
MVCREAKGATVMTSKAPVWVRGAAWLALIAAALDVLAGPLTRFGAIDFRPAIQMLGIAGMVAGAAALGCLIGWLLVRRRDGRPGAGLALAGLLAGGIAFGFVAMLLVQARSVPPIHDISTDTADPPQFVAIVPLRADAANPPGYAGAEVAAQQRAAYPHIRTYTFPTTPAELVDRTVRAVEAMGWEIVAVIPGEGRVEATDTTAWFGFKDDVVVRIRPAPEGATFDVRSKSRVGMSDLGANAERIAMLIERVQGYYPDKM